jgi:hypothetical protein
VAAPARVRHVRRGADAARAHVLAPLPPYSPHYRAFADELESYAAWYKAHEEPAMDDAAFVAKDAFALELTDFRARFGAPR